MCRKCNKCGAYLEKDPDGVYTCTNCLQDIIKIKRELWENENLVDKKQVDDLEEDC